MFEVYFQNGEFLSDQMTFLGIGLDTIFTVSITIGIFFAGEWFKRLYDRKKEFERLKSIEMYLFKLLELIEEPAEKQKVKLEEFVNQIREEKEQHFQLSYVASLNMEPIKEIDNQDLFQIFIARRKGNLEYKTELFGKIRHQIDYLHAVQSSLKEVFEKMMSEHRSYDSKFKEHFKTSHKLFDFWIAENVRNKLSREDDLFLAKVDELRAAWIKKERADVPYYDMFITNEEYYAPLKDLCKQFLHDPRASVLLEQVMECQQAVNNIRNIKDLYSNGFEERAKGIGKSIDEIRTALSQLKSLEFS